MLFGFYYFLAAVRSAGLRGSNERGFNLDLSICTGTFKADNDLINRLKQELQAMPEFQECIELYNTLRL
jgi:hypothetical protein